MSSEREEAGPDDERLVEEEAETAAAEAARIGGEVPRDSDDPAEEPLSAEFGEADEPIPPDG